MNIQYGLNLSYYNSYHISSICKRAFFPENLSELIKVLETSENNIILGGGCNIILSRKEYNDLDFIILRDNFSGIKVENENTISALAGTDLKDLSIFAYKNGLSGLEVYYDIPGTVGGAVVMNAGASGKDFSQILVDVTYMDRKNKIVKTLSVADLGYEYRGSIFQDNHDLIVLSAKFNLIKDESNVIFDRMLSITKQRWIKQPREYPSAGSVFKRPKGHYVGPMIESLGLKGFKIGGAEVSKRHAGFIINVGGATGEDVLALIKKIQGMVYDKFDVMLSVEQRII